MQIHSQTPCIYTYICANTLTHCRYTVYDTLTQRGIYVSHCIYIEQRGLYTHCRELHCVGINRVSLESGQEPLIRVNHGKSNLDWYWYWRIKMGQISSVFEAFWPKNWRNLPEMWRNLIDFVWLFYEQMIWLIMGLRGYAQMVPNGFSVLTPNIPTI